MKHRPIPRYLTEHIRLLYSLRHGAINRVVNAVLKARNQGSTIFICGNGGSASTASHIACDWSKLNEGLAASAKKFRIVSIADNLPLITAYANDLSYEEIFIQQLRNLLRKNDVVIGLSVSGNSKNVLRAIDYANRKGCVTIGFVGKRNSTLTKRAKHCLTINNDHFGHVEDIHLLLGHLIKDTLRARQ